MHMRGRRLPLWGTCRVYSFTCFTLVVAILDAVHVCLEAPLNQTIYNLQQSPSWVAALAYQVGQKNYFGRSYVPWRIPASRRNKLTPSGSGLDKKGNKGQKPSQCHSILVTLWSWLMLTLDGCWLNLHSSFSNMHKVGSASNVSFFPSPLQSFLFVGAPQMFSVCRSNAPISYFWLKKQTACLMAMQLWWKLPS